MPLESRIWISVRSGSSPGSQRVGLLLRLTRTCRPARLRTSTFWLDSSVIGPAQGQVRGVWGLFKLAPGSASRSVRLGLGPSGSTFWFIAQSWVRMQPRSAVMQMSSAPFDSDLLARPAPDHPRSGWIVQSWVLLRTRPAACGVCLLPLRPHALCLDRSWTRTLSYQARPWQIRSQAGNLRVRRRSRPGPETDPPGPEQGRPSQSLMEREPNTLWIWAGAGLTTEPSSQKKDEPEQDKPNPNRTEREPTSPTRCDPELEPDQRLSYPARTWMIRSRAGRV
jgi:hypothetical protein